MAIIHFDKQGSFSNAVDLTMVLNESTNNSVPVAQKVGYIFDGWYCDYTSGGYVEEKVVTVYEDDTSWIAAGKTEWEAGENPITVHLSDGTSYLLDDATVYRRYKVVTVYEDDVSWIADYIEGSDTPEVTQTIKVYDSDGHAVESDFIWSANYPNGVYINCKDITVYPIWVSVPFVNEYFDSSDERCHIYAEIDGVMTRVELLNADRN